MKKAQATFTCFALLSSLVLSLLTPLPAFGSDAQISDSLSTESGCIEIAPGETHTVQLQTQQTNNLTVYAEFDFGAETNGYAFLNVNAWCPNTTARLNKISGVVKFYSRSRGNKLMDTQSISYWNPIPTWRIDDYIVSDYYVPSDETVYTYYSLTVSGYTISQTSFANYTPDYTRGLVGRAHVA